MRLSIAHAVATLACLAALTHAAEPAPAAGRVIELEAMDRSADPCTQFYRFANGGWLDANPVPADRSRWGAYDEAGERNLGLLRAIAENAAGATDATDLATRLVGDFWASGMDQAHVEALGAAPLAQELVRIDAIADRRQLLAALARMHRLGVDALVDFSVVQDARNTARYIPQFWQGGLGLPERDYYLKGDAATRKIRSEYLQHVAAMFNLLGDSPAAAQRGAQRVLALETRLARASLSNVALRDPQRVYHLRTVAALAGETRPVSWAPYFAGIGVPEASDINVGQPAFVRAAAQLVATQPLADWKTYLRWHWVDSAAPYLSRAFVEQDFAFKGKTLAGAKELRPRWKRVVEASDTQLGEALGKLYVERHFPPAAKARADALVAELRAAMSERIARLAWMSPATRSRAQEKLALMRVKIGYPERWRDYSGLALARDDYLGNVLRAQTFEFERNLAKLGKPVDRTEWQMSAPTVNAYYDPTQNEMVFPAGILQPPFFSVDAEDADNFGNIGATIGHEMTHGFDDEGRQFDAHGNLRNWWTPADEREFVARAIRIVRQFGEFRPIDNLAINGRLTAGENIADLGGLIVAWDALRRTLAGNPAPAPRDGFTPAQRFFIAYAQSNRENIRPERLRLQLATDPHAPARERTLGPIADMPEFAEAFACPAQKSPLRPPATRVEIW